MSEKINQKVNEHKAWDMAHAEKPFRDKKLELISKRKEQFVARIKEIKKLADDPTMLLKLMKPNADEVSYAQAARTNAPDHGYALNGNRVDLPTDPVSVIKIAKALLDQRDVRSHRILTKGHKDMQHPLDAEVDKMIADYEGKSFDGDPNFVRQGALDIMRERLPKALGVELTDPSRSVAGDEASEAIGEFYDETQTLLEEIRNLLGED